MSSLHVHANLDTTRDADHHADNTVIREAWVVGMLVAILFIGALLVSALMLGLKFAVVGTFVAFPMMLLIGMPLILATIGDDLEEHAHRDHV